MDNKLTDNEIEVLEVLIHMYLLLDNIDAAERGLKALIAVCPKNLWALGARAIVCDKKGEYKEVIRFTDDLSAYSDDKKKALNFLRARAFMKLGDEVKAKECLFKKF